MGSGFVTLKVFFLFCFDSFIGTGECQRGGSGAGSGENDLSPDGQGSRSSWARYEELHLFSRGTILRASSGGLSVTARH